MFISIIYYIYTLIRFKWNIKFPYYADNSYSEYGIIIINIDRGFYARVLGMYDVGNTLKRGLPLLFPNVLTVGECITNLTHHISRSSTQYCQHLNTLITFTSSGSHCVYNIITAWFIKRYKVRIINTILSNIPYINAMN